MTHPNPPEVVTQGEGPVEVLRPCPFCGASGDKLVQAFTQATETFAYWSVECTGCGVEVGDDASQEAANTAWNTRPETPSTRLAGGGELRALSEKATAGEWSWEDNPPTVYAGRTGDHGTFPGTSIRIQRHGYNLFGRLNDLSWNGRADLDFAVACVNYVRQILAREGEAHRLRHTPQGCA